MRSSTPPRRRTPTGRRRQPSWKPSRAFRRILSRRRSPSGSNEFIQRDDRVNPLGLGDWRAAKAAIGAYYADRGFRPVWADADGLTAAGRAAAARIARAPEDGLSPGPFPLPGKLTPPLDPEAIADAEVALAADVVAYAEQASGSRLSPARVSPIVSTAPKVADPGEALAETAAAPDPDARLADFNPPQKGYRALREALMRMDAAANNGARTDAAALDPGGAVSDAPAFGDDPLFGAAGPGRAKGRADLASAASGRAHGAAARERAVLLANMEMWRWEPRDMGERRIEVNIPDFSVSVMDGDAVLMSSRVVVGKPDTPTPVFSDRMRYVLINPAWDVPEFDRQERDPAAPRSFHPARLRSEERSAAEWSCASLPETTTHSGVSPSCSPTITPCTCTTRRRASCSPTTCGRSAMDACGSRIPSVWPKSFWDGPRIVSRRRLAARSVRYSCRSRCRSTSNISRPSSMPTARSRNARTCTASPTEWPAFCLRKVKIETGGRWVYTPNRSICPAPCRFGHRAAECVPVLRAEDALRTERPAGRDRRPEDMRTGERMGSEVTAAPIRRAAYRKDDLLRYCVMIGGWRGATSSAAVAAVVLAAALAPNSTESAVANGDTRTVTFSSRHTNEEGSFTYMVNGVYDQAVLDKLNWFMRDWRLNEPTKMDPKLFDIIWEVYRESGSREPIDVLSGYRSPQTNAMLRRRSRQVAEHSQHMQGKAIDAHFVDVSTARIRDIAMRMQEGGTGFYPSGMTPWVHIDSGDIRYWPRMSRDALTRLFPDGKTVFIPADGQPMPGYDLAKAEIEQRGGEVQTASRGGLFAWLFGSRGGGDDDAEEAGGQEAVVASNTGGRGGRGVVAPAPAPVEVADAGTAAVAKDKHSLPTGPADAEPEAAAPAPAPAPEPVAKEQLVAALEQPEVASDAATDASVDLTGPIAALDLAPLPPRRPPNLEQQLALLADIPLPPVQLLWCLTRRIAISRFPSHGVRRCHRNSL